MIAPRPMSERPQIAFIETPRSPVTEQMHARLARHPLRPAPKHTHARIDRLWLLLLRREPGRDLRSQCRLISHPSLRWFWPRWHPAPILHPGPLLQLNHQHANLVVLILEVIRLHPFLLLQAGHAQLKLPPKITDHLQHPESPVLPNIRADPRLQHLQQQPSLLREGNPLRWDFPNASRWDFPNAPRARARRYKALSLLIRLNNCNGLLYPLYPLYRYKGGTGGNQPGARFGGFFRHRWDFPNAFRPMFIGLWSLRWDFPNAPRAPRFCRWDFPNAPTTQSHALRSEEHTSELQS